MTTTKVREKAKVRLSHELQHKISVMAAQKGTTKNAILETLVNIGLSVHSMIEEGLVIPKKS